MNLNRHVWKRLSWRVPIIAACWAMPTFLDVDPSAAEKWQAACLVALIAVFASWQSKQGRSRRERTGGGDD